MAGSIDTATYISGNTDDSVSAILRVGSAEAPRRRTIRAISRLNQPRVKAWGAAPASSRICSLEVVGERELELGGGGAGGRCWKRRGTAHGGKGNAVIDGIAG